MAEQDPVQQETQEQLDGAAQPAVPTDQRTDAGERPLPTQREVEEYRDLLQRERASFQNYRRRVESERAAQVAQSRAEALLPLLPILDDLERAAAGVPSELREQPWVKGVLLITDKLASAVAAAGLERIDPKGEPFDPRYHEAFLHERHATIAPGRVSTVMRPGYRVGDRVLRAAQVAVSEGPPEERAGGTSPDADDS